MMKILFNKQKARADKQLFMHEKNLNIIYYPGGYLIKFNSLQWLSIT